MILLFYCKKKIKRSERNLVEMKKEQKESEPLWFVLRLQDQTESAAIMKIKESMQEEAKRFEPDTDHPDYFNQWFFYFIPG